MPAQTLGEQARQAEQTAVPTPRQEFWAGARATVPLVIGAIPFGLIFGAVAVTGGLSGAAAAGMSALVYAGSSQFVAAQLVSAGTGLAVIVLTTFVVNLRHSLYAATLAPHVRHLPQRWLLPLGFTLTDETFVVVAEHYARPGDAANRHWFYLGSSAIMYTNWQVCTWIGIVAGQSLPNPAGWGLDFALVVTFIGMLMPGLRTRPIVACSVAAGAVALLAAGLPNQLGLMVAALAGVAAGVGAERLQKRGAR